MNKQTIKNLEINVKDLEKRVTRQENYLANTSKLNKGFAKESTALKRMKEALKVESLRLSNAECMCF